MSNQTVDLWEDLKNHVINGGSIFSYSKLIGIKRDYIYEEIGGAKVKYLKTLKNKKKKLKIKKESLYTKYMIKYKEIMIEKKVFPVGRFNRMNEDHKFKTLHGIMISKPSLLAKNNFAYTIKSFENKLEYYKNEFKIKRPKLYSIINCFYKVEGIYIYGLTKYGEFKIHIRGVLEYKKGEKNPKIQAACYLDKIKYYNNYNKLHLKNNLEVISHKGEYLIVKDNYGFLKIYEYHFLKGIVPQIRTAINPTEYCKNQFIKKHGDTYNYDNFIYKGDNKKSIITCKIHGNFKQTVNNHKEGKGCKDCLHGMLNIYEAKKKKEEFLLITSGYYIMSIQGKETYYKAGISKNFNQRIKNIRRVLGEEYKVEYLLKVKCNLYEAIFAEHFLLKEDAYNNKYTPEKKFNGYTECFINKNLNIDNYKKDFYHHSMNNIINLI